MPEYLTINHLTTKDITRIFSKMRISTERFYNNEPCWEWQQLFDSGYGQFYCQGKNHRVHRFFYAWLVTPIPKGQEDGEVDHLCKNIRCVNPAHLEHVPRVINVRRSNAPSAQYGRRTHCKEGHPLIGEIGNRNCYPCRYANLKKRKAANPAYADDVRRRQREAKKREYSDPKNAEKRRARSRAYYHKKKAATEDISSSPTAVPLE